MTLARQSAVWETPSANAGKPWWRRLPGCAPWRTPPACGQAGLRPARARRGFTLVELLVVVAIILLLMSLLGAAVSAARSSQKANETRSLISRLDTIIQSQLARYNSANVDASVIDGLTKAPNTIPNRAAARAWYIRRNMITADLPDRWTDVQFMATPANGWVPQSSAQRAYISIWNSASPKPSAAFAGAECLFMIVMLGGLAEPSDIGPLKTSDIGDKDQDGAPEFWDSWGNPIGYILWPAAVRLPVGSDSLFFSGSREPKDPFSANSSPTLRLKPLIYSAGPDGEYCFDRQNETENLSCGSGPVGKDCGNWLVAPTSLAAGLSLVDGADKRADNITNLDAEAKP